MNCEHAADALLEADLAELRGAGDAPLAAHLRTCERCRTLAGRILDAETALAETLAAERPKRPAHEAAAAAIAAASASRTWRSRFRVAALAGAGIAAAGIAAVLLVNGGGPSPTQTPRPAMASGRPITLLEASPGQHVVVFQTDNPNIVIIWTF